MDVEAEKKYLKEKYSINSPKELREAVKKLRLNIGCFVTPLPAPPSKSVDGQKQNV